MRFTRWHSGLVVCMVLSATLLFAVPAQATITASTITSPQNGADLFWDGDTGSGTLTVRGTVAGATPGGTGDLLCYTNSNLAFYTLATKIDVTTGSFVANVSLSPVAGQVCRLRLVPSFTNPTGTATTPFAGPALSVGERFSHATVGNLYDYYVLAGTVPWSYAFESLGDCPIASSYATDPVTLVSFSLFTSNACLEQSGALTRPALVVDGSGAYLPGAISALSGEVGFEPLTYTATFDASHDTVTISETDIPMVCDPPGTYPPGPASCPSMHDSGIRIIQTTTLLPGGQVVRLSQQLQSVDGHAHNVDELYWQSAQGITTGQPPGFQFPGQTAVATDAAPDSISSFPSGPGSILVVGDPTAVATTGNPIGSITYDRPPSDVSFINGPGTQTSTFLMHYVDSVPAGGSVVHRWSFVQSASASDLASLTRRERGRLGAPTVQITRPANGATVYKSTVRVTGTAADLTGFTLKLGKWRIRRGANGSFAVTVHLHRGRNVIVFTASDVNGHVTRTALTLTYRTAPCIVPRLRRASLRAAELALYHADCRLGRITTKRSRSVPSGRIISSRPGRGARRHPGAVVSVVLSRGRG